MTIEKDTSYILFSILRSVFHEKPMCDADKSLVTKDILQKVMQAAKKHDIAHLAALGVLRNALVEESEKTKFQRITYMAVYRHEKRQYELGLVCDALEKAKIQFIPLKGSVLQKYYPEPWMRTSCDIDIFVHKEDIERAASYLSENLQYVRYTQSPHDIAFCSPRDVHVELHYDLVEESYGAASSKILKDVWQRVAPKKGATWQYEMTDEMFYYYHIAHMAKHFEGGGCGIRPIIDLWILDKINMADTEKRRALLQMGEKLRFAEAAQALSRVWLENAQPSPLAEKMQNYILYGGVYGNKENKIALQQQKKGGKMRYVFSRIILPYDRMKSHYPILEKYPWLTPAMHVRRWGRNIFGRRAKRTWHELSYNQSLTKTQTEEMKKFLHEIGL